MFLHDQSGKLLYPSIVRAGLQGKPAISRTRGRASGVVRGVMNGLVKRQTIVGQTIVGQTIVGQTIVGQDIPGHARWSACGARLSADWRRFARPA
jgi:hypothetical protein